MFINNKSLKVMMSSDVTKFNETLSAMFGHSQIFDTHLTSAFKTFTDMLSNGGHDILTKTIQTKVGVTGSTYKTDLEVDGNITNEFPTLQPAENDIYWKRHNDLVNEVLSTRKEIILKVIETCGTTIKGIINPISIVPLDINK